MKQREKTCQKTTGIIGIGIAGILLILCGIAWALLRREETPAKQETTDVLVQEAVPLESQPAKDRTEQLLEQDGGMNVFIKTQASFGSGVLFAVTEDALFVVTAAHVLPQGQEEQEVSVTFCDGTSVLCENLWRTSDADIAFLQIPLSRLADGKTEEYCYAAVNKERYDALSAWDTVLCMGMSMDSKPTGFEGYLIDNWIYVEDFAQYMMVAQCQIQPGMSGGGLYDEQGYLIGILCGGNDQGEIAAVPLHVVQAKYADRK